LHLAPCALPIVTTDMTKLYCLIIGEPAYTAFPVDISLSEDVYELKKRIKVVRPDVENFAHWKIMRVNVPIKELSKLKLNYNFQALKPQTIDLIALLSSCFSEVPKEHLHILIDIQPPSSKSQSKLRYCLNFLESHYFLFL
jgi:hypothetical protein